MKEHQPPSLPSRTRRDQSDIKAQTVIHIHTSGSKGMLSSKFPSVGSRSRPAQPKTTKRGPHAVATPYASKLFVHDWQHTTTATRLEAARESTFLEGNAAMCIATCIPVASRHCHFAPTTRAVNCTTPVKVRTCQFDVQRVTA